MSKLKSIDDPAVQQVIAAENKTFHPSPSAWEDQLIYFLLCDRFSNGKENLYIDNNGNQVTNGTTAPYTDADNGNALGANTETWLDAGAKFCGGTISGVITKLGYLKRMGITAIWLGPIFKQVAALETYHGYGVQNFLEVDPRFGTKDELKELVGTAHAMGFYVILDIIMNHSGDVFEYIANSPTYNAGQKYPVKGFYNAQHTADVPFPTPDPNTPPDIYPDGAIWPQELQAAGVFTCEGQINANGWDALPEYLDGDFFDLKDFNLGPNQPDGFSPTPALRTLTAAYKYWIAYLDIDGYRLDTVKHMGFGPTRYFCGAIHEFATRIGKGNFMVVGEITGGLMYETVEATGLDAALGIQNVMQTLWQVPRGEADADDYFDHFRNARYLQKGSHSWLRNKILTMVDDHDQVWRGDYKARFSAWSPGASLMFAALALNVCTLGIPCIYYGSEQRFDGQGGSGSPGHGADQFIREAMFGGEFGAFRSKDAHCFNEESPVYKGIAALSKIRAKELTLRRGRQYLREISGDESSWGYPTKVGARMMSIVAWSRIFDTEEILCAINTDEVNERTAWVTLDSGIQSVGKVLKCLFPLDGNELNVVSQDGRMVVSLTVPPAGFALFK
ncbi:alpha-amylase [Microthyrium microscopicum]|uniref:Alpha-amylase n=1 Tax=Microthyrium microscopicum TaxID=703497 RepID=A0A6A6UET0_9PEZI|nr:alpha-amylase [Microthyrium microscopicum]